MSYRSRIVLLCVLAAFIVSVVGWPLPATGASSLANPGPATSALTPPDDPNPLSYNPNSMQDIQRADPDAGINLIELPPGRNGMQPQLSINYNSSDVNGWMGLGWNLSLFYITIDTRWGVPR